MTVRYFLRSDKRESDVTIWARIRTTTDDVRVPTDETILASRWDKKAGLPKAVNKRTDPELYEKMSKVSSRLEDLRERLIVHVDQLIEKGSQITAKELTNFISKEVEKPDRIPSAITEYTDWLIQRMKDGSFKHGSETYDYDTIKVWTVFSNVLKRFESEYEKASGRVILWETLDKAVFDAFVKSLQDYGYLVKTCNKLIICFRALIQYSYAHHLHDNLKCLPYLQKLREVEGCATTKTYLNSVEIEALYNMELPAGSLKDQVRDVFLIGVFTCQRVSDYNHLEPSNFSTTDKGNRVIRLRQEKTDNSIVVPILNDHLQCIVEKYNYALPHLNDVILNRYIKQILKDLSETVPSLKTPIRTALTLPERRALKEGTLSFEKDAEGHYVKPKYDLISSHSARRSGITILYKSALFNTRQLMSISGHRSESNFFLYIAQGADELADEIAEIMAKAKAKAGNEELF